MKRAYSPFDNLFIDIYNNNYLYLVKYLIMIVHDLGVAEDLAHDVFLRIYKSGNMNLAGVISRSYIKKSARNIAIDHIRKKKREEARNAKIIPEIKELNETFYSKLEDSVINGEVMSTVSDVLENFSEKKRKIFISRVIENKTRREISEEENLTSYAVKRVEDEILFIMKEKLKYFR